MSDFLDDFRANWDNSYWWADHQLLMAGLIGVIGLAIHALHLLMERAWGGPPAPEASS
jgi:hypothetical protein